MTDHHLDELASAYLDGAATPEEVAQVEADPALRRRVEALSQVQSALRQPTPVDDATRETALAAARAAFEEADGGGAATPLQPPPAARWRWSPRTVKLVGAAAVALLLAAAVPLLSRVGDDDDAQAARFEEASGALGDAESGGPDRAADATAEEAGPTSTTSATGGRGDDGAGAFRADLGAFDTLEDLLAALAAPAETMASPTPEQAQPGDALCPIVLPEGALVAAAEVAGEPVVAVVAAPDEDGERLATVYRTRDCRVLERAPLP